MDEDASRDPASRRWLKSALAGVAFGRDTRSQLARPARPTLPPGAKRELAAIDVHTVQPILPGLGIVAMTVEPLTGMGAAEGPPGENPAASTRDGRSTSFGRVRTARLAFADAAGRPALP